MKGKGGINNLSLSHCIPIQGKWVSISVCAVQEFVFLGEFTLAATDTKTTVDDHGSTVWNSVLVYLCNLSLMMQQLSMM